MPADNAYPGPGPGPDSDSDSGSGSGSTSASDLAFEQTLRELFDRATRSVVAPADLTVRVCAPAPPRHQRGGRKALVLVAAALATSSVIIGGLTVERHLPSDRGLNVITPAAGSPLPGPATGATTHPGVPPAGVATVPPAAPVPPDQATVDEITTAFTEAFDGDDNIDDGLAYVQNGERYRDITRGFIQRYPGVVGNLKVQLENITLIAGNQARATIILTHTDPQLGRKWGYQIRREVVAVRVDGHWLVSSGTYSFLVGSA
ncbi:hypothetical protein [Parafrankia sp. BMG5.11]|uniref:hypothetical protein n=1 Tax=Parafrankia sp. BMG5.11 TaxID=222540 RepID=UPI00103BB186|nr:hypothetical protein [Parafrankia sp. BMG5.11]TCJ34189.1 hypothetical protein E0504_33515 [Parafrankia sp. BMG5.11]